MAKFFITTFCNDFLEENVHETMTQKQRALKNF